MAKPTSLILVLSDLHFGSDLSQEADRQPLEVPRKIRLLRPGVQRFFHQNCKAHDATLLSHLPRYLVQLVFRARQEGYPRRNFDLCLLLGDQATYPTERSFRFVSDYLTRETCTSSQTSLSCKGLALPPERLVAVPGNHDKLLKSNLDIYHQAFSATAGISSVPQTNGSHLLSRTVGGSTWTFILLDANVFAAKEMTLDLTINAHLACGKVSEALHDSVVTKLARVKAGHAVDQVTPEEFEESYKVLLVHYAPDVLAAGGFSKRLKSAVPSHNCPGLDKLIGSISEDLDLVIHGHLHVPKIYRSHGVPIVSAASTSQRASKNGFFTLTSYASGEVRAEHHLFHGTGFAVDPNPQLSLQL